MNSKKLRQATDLALFGSVIVTGALLTAGVTATLIVASPWLIARWLNEPL